MIKSLNILIWQKMPYYYHLFYMFHFWYVYPFDNHFSMLLKPTKNKCSLLYCKPISLYQYIHVTLSASFLSNFVCQRDWINSQVTSIVYFWVFWKLNPYGNSLLQKLWSECLMDSSCLGTWFGHWLDNDTLPFFPILLKYCLSKNFL